MGCAMGASGHHLPMPRIPEETIQQVLAATDIVDLVGRSVKLRRMGSTFSGLCPFHNEKSPSFYVYPSNASYHCFGCGAGGTAIRFLMEHDGMGFVEAVKRLGDAAGIRIEEEVWDAQAEESAKVRAALLRVHKEVTEWYHLLLTRHACGDAARAYLKSRGMNSDLAKRWQLGYAPPSGDALREWAADHDISEGLLIDSGIMAAGDPESDRPGTYPRFRHRLMFPIRNDNGEVIAFSGRLLEANAKAAKYLNSPETPLFTKSRVLFGFDRSKRPISKAGQALIVEGQIDMITVFEAGFENVVASQGTAFTELHAKLLKRHADEVLLCFDSDNAGFKAAEKAFQILAPTGLNVKVAAIPAGEDPDSLIRKQGKEAFSSLLGKAADFIDFQIEASGSRRNLTEMRERVRFAEEMAVNVRLFESPVAREASIQRVAVRLNLPEETFRRQVIRGMTSGNKAGSSIKTNASSGHQLLVSQDKTATLLCRLVLSSAEVAQWLRASGKESLLQDLPGTELLSLVWHSKFDPAEPSSVSAFLSSLEPVEENAFAEMLAQSAPPGGLEEAAHALEAMETSRLQTQISRAQTQLKQPGLSPEAEGKIHQQIIAWRKEYLDRRKRS